MLWAQAPEPGEAREGVPGGRDSKCQGPGVGEGAMCQGAEGGGRVRGGGGAGREWGGRNDSRTVGLEPSTIWLFWLDISF